MHMRMMAAVMAATAALWSADAAFQVHVDVRDAKGKEFAETAKKVCEEWYPKINAAIFGPDYPLPYPEVRIVFQPKITTTSGEEIPAYTDGNTIYVNSPYVAEAHKQTPGDFGAMMAHELTHVDQHYPPNFGPGWLMEGIADYVRHKYFEKDIEPRLHLDKNGNLTGFELDRNQGTFATEGYLGGYTVTGAFLDWLEVRKDQEIVGVLNRALHDGRYSVGIFQERCGASLGDLWREFVAQSRN